MKETGLSTRAREVQIRFSTTPVGRYRPRDVEVSDAIHGMAMNYLTELQTSVSRYRPHLGSGGLWKHCDGKRVIKELAARVGIPGQSMTLEAAIARVWITGEVPLHSEWAQVDRFLKSL